jgi:hypothetical protein
MWGIGNGAGQLNGKITIKNATDRRGWLKYMAKEENVPGWRSMTTAEAVTEWNDSDN